jgi:hypothetical protein
LGFLGSSSQVCSVQIEIGVEHFEKRVHAGAPRWGIDDDDRYGTCNHLFSYCGIAIVENRCRCLHRLSRRLALCFLKLLEERKLKGTSDRNFFLK